MRIKLPLALCFALLLAARLAWAEVAAIAPGSLVNIQLTEAEATYSITPDSSQDYDLCAFPGEGFEGELRAALYEDGALLATGSADEGVTLMTAALRAGAGYELRLSGAGRVTLELARHALSRCFDDPKPLSALGDTYEKAVVNPGDAHWYAITAEEAAPIVLWGLPEEAGLRLQARLYSDSGRLLAEATRTAGGAMLMDFMPRTDRAYRVRVSAEGGGTGLYRLSVAPGAGGLPEALILSDARLTLQGRESHALEVTVLPEGAAGALLWESSDETVAAVSQQGVVSGRRPGTAVVTAYAAGAVTARCRVEVRRVEATGLKLITGRVHMSVGDDVAVEWSVLPENASDPRVDFDLQPEGVAEIDINGVLRAVAPGTATLTLRTADGGHAASVGVHVDPADVRRRALLVGEQGYSPDVASPRPGGANSVSGMRSMLNELSFQGSRYALSTALDIPAEGVLRAIERAFDGATDQDESLFYITCHGYYAHGMTVFQMYDGSELTALELRQALDRVPGRILLMLDCCGSGGVTGQPGDILDGLETAFTPGPAAFGSSKYRVLASAMVEQDSYRLSFDHTHQESRMATLFARAVCEGCGWSIDDAQRRAMRADINYDGAVTLDELYHYARRRVMWYLGLTGSGYTQTVQVWPQGCGEGVFGREGTGDDR